MSKQQPQQKQQQMPKGAAAKKESGFMKKLIYMGVVVPLSLVVLDQFLGPSKYYKETPLGILQTKLPQGVTEILDPKTGKLKHAGYGMGMEDTLKVNYQDARSASDDPKSFLNRLRYRSWNYFLMTTPTHMIQFNFVDVISNAAGTRGFCPSSLIIVDRNDPLGSF